MVAKKKKYKRMTNAEKELNKKIREDLRERGILPPAKPRLNRSKFAREVMQGYDNFFNKYEDLEYLLKAIPWMLPPISNPEVKSQITPEQIGVLKTLKLAMEIKKFEDAKKGNKETKYTYGELYENVVRPIINL